MTELKKLPIVQLFRLDGLFFLGGMRFVSFLKPLMACDLTQFYSRSYLDTRTEQKQKISVHFIILDFVAAESGTKLKAEFCYHQ